MRSKTFEVPGVLALLLLLAAGYGSGYILGIDLTGSVIVALFSAFALSCLTMISVVLIAAVSGEIGKRVR